MSGSPARRSTRTAELAQLLRRIHRPQRPAHRRLRDRQADHRPVWRRRLRAVACGDPIADARSGRRRSCGCAVVEGYVDQVDVAAGAAASTAISFPNTPRRSSAERPANLFTIERYLLLAGDLPGLRLKNRLGAFPHPPRCRRPSSSRSSRNRSTRLPDPTISAAGRAGRYQFLGSASIKNAIAHPRRLHRSPLQGLVPDQGAQIRRRQLPPGPQQRGPFGLRVRRLRLGPARDVRRSKASITRPRASIFEAGLTLSGAPHAPCVTSA